MDFEDFKTNIRPGLREILHDRGSKGFRLTFNLYAKEVDWWILCRFYVENGIDGMAPD